MFISEVSNMHQNFPEEGRFPSVLVDLSLSLSLSLPPLVSLLRFVHDFSRSMGYFSTKCSDPFFF